MTRRSFFRSLFAAPLVAAVPKPAERPSLHFVSAHDVKRVYFKGRMTEGQLKAFQAGFQSVINALPFPPGGLNG